MAFFGGSNVVDVVEGNTDETFLGQLEILKQTVGL
jgi:hypothetical protein